MWNQPKVHPAAGWEIMWNDTWATSFIIISSSPDNQWQSDSAARARFSANQDNTLNLHSPHACCYCLILASVCSCVCVQHGTHRVSGLIVESGILKIHRGAAAHETHARVLQHKGLCTSGSWWCSWFFLFHLLHFETNWQQHFTVPRSVSVKLKTELDHCKRGNCPHAVLYVSCLCCSNGVMQHHLSVVDGRWSPQMEKDHDVQSYVIKQKTMQCGWFLKELNVCPVVSSTVCSVLFSSRRSLK